MKHLKYLSYVVRHKWYVFLEACKLGIPWLGLIHDWSKFLPSEFFAYADYFHGEKPPTEHYSEGYIKPTDTGHAGFEMGWHLHIHRNKHHWQWWIRNNDDGYTKIFPMPLRYLKEMLADWRGAGIVQGKPDTLAWYVANNKKLKLHPESREWIETQLGVGAYHGAFIKLKD